MSLEQPVESYQLHAESSSDDSLDEPLPQLQRSPTYERPRKQRITKAQSNNFKEWLIALPQEQKNLSAAKLAKLYEETHGLTVSRMFVCNAKRSLRDVATQTH